ncbi:MAG TPA: ornithine carbamoyltransferase [Caulobacteraceae bacterium]
MTAPRHFLDLWRLQPEALRWIVDEAHRRKATRAGQPKGAPDADAPAADRTVAMVFELPSTRTRYSFDAACRQLGAAAVSAHTQDMQLGRGEAVEDTARAMSRMVDAVLVRASRHEDLERFAQAASVPVINGLTDRSHPCHVAADILTMEEARGPIAGRTVAWVGDGNNVCATYIQAAARLGFKLNIACPPVYHPDLLELARAAQAGAEVQMTDDPRMAVTGADAVVTDTWVSSYHADGAARIDAFEPYQVDEALMARAKEDAIFLHCLPVHRGEEVVDEVVDGPHSRVWDAAENRIHAQKAILLWCLGHGPG